MFLVEHRPGQSCAQQMRQYFNRDKPEPYWSICQYQTTALKSIIADNVGQGPWLNGLDGRWGRPLHAAVFCDAPDVIQMLLDAGASPDASYDFQDDTPWTLAAKLGRRTILRRFWARIPVQAAEVGSDSSPRSRQTDPITTLDCLCYAAEHGQVAAVRDILDWQSWTINNVADALGSAACGWSDDVAELLLSRATPPVSTLNAILPTACNLKPLRDNRISTEYEGFDAVRQELLVARLIRAGAEPNVPKARGGLHLVHLTASLAYLVGALKALLENGFDPNIVDVRGRTALHGLGWPVRQADRCLHSPRLNYTAAHLLLRHGASVLCPDELGNTPVHYAAAGSDICLFSMYASAANLTEIARIRNHAGETALHWAAAGGKTDILEYLISLDPDRSSVDLPNAHGWTPLMCAAAGSATTVDIAHTVFCLLDHGANPNVTTAEGWNVLHALSRHADDDPESVLGQVAERLLQSGVDKERRARPLAGIDRRWWLASPFPGNNGFQGYYPAKNGPDANMSDEMGTPLHWAAEHGGLGVAKALLVGGADSRAKNDRGDMCVQVAYKARGRLSDGLVQGFLRLIREYSLDSTATRGATE